MIDTKNPFTNLDEVRTAREYCITIRDHADAFIAHRHFDRYRNGTIPSISTRQFKLVESTCIEAEDIPAHPTLPYEDVPELFLQPTFMCVVYSSHKVAHFPDKDVHLRMIHLCAEWEQEYHLYIVDDQVVMTLLSRNQGRLNPIS